MAAGDRSMSTEPTRIKASALQPGDVYQNGNRKVFAVYKSGAWMFVRYYYRVGDDSIYGGYSYSWYHRDPQIEKLHVNKLVAGEHDERSSRSRNLPADRVRGKAQRCHPPRSSGLGRGLEGGRSGSTLGPRRWRACRPRRALGPGRCSTSISASVTSPSTARARWLVRSQVADSPTRSVQTQKR